MASAFPVGYPIALGVVHADYSRHVETEPSSPGTRSLVRTGLTPVGREADV